ncbi:hypothetical protein MN116_001911 [Schistosoma mekongi]|uniref:Uncharacterized protein n=1 Tax=Schistosoma mekongi TaxID=38744 RepID=A0AAE2D8A4_SCHME|nr:hypothetical protein MN116_001911 [Schistosoma mekongi]
MEKWWFPSKKLLVVKSRLQFELADLIICRALRSASRCSEYSFFGKYDEILSKSKGSRVGDSFGRSKPKHRYSGRTNLFSRRSGLSNSRKQALFFATGALTGIYIASHIKPRIKSYRDLCKFSS